MQPGGTINPENSEGENFYSQPDAVADAPAALAEDDGTITWRASEYVEHEKSIGWYLILSLVSVAIVGLVYLLTDDAFSAGIFAVGAVLFGIVGARKPRTLNYTIDHSGITIGETIHRYEHFKTFSVIEEDAMHSIILLPLKRFMPPLMLYYPPEQEQTVAETLGMYIPYQDKGQDAFDRLMARIRF